ncbi:hypothetical protein FBULB1_3324 [Fusarium bulbicola]|nr:hypothetical protein FBULB1_3324 [Fusarium bulbicola]
MWTFRTHPRRVTVDKRVGILGAYGKDTQPPKFRPRINLEGTNLGPGSLVNVVIEITIDSTTRHPFPFLQLPKCGPFDYWEEAFRLGVRVEFEEEGIWKTRYLKQQTLSNFGAKVKGMKASDFGAELDHLDIGWLHCIKIIAALLNWRWQAVDDVLAKRVWVPYCCRLRLIEFDFFRQNIVVSDATPVIKQHPRPLTLDETADLIEGEFGEDVHIGCLPDNVLIQTPRPGVRQKCDLCLVASDDIRIAKQCKTRRQVVKTIDGVDLVQCPFSTTMGRYCTFTENIEHRDDLRELVYRPSDNYEIKAIDPPPNVFQYLEMREKLNEESAPEDVGGD